ncbi:MAG: laccase domain-containing protein, partial [Bacillati bacterium ANGP1]
MAPGGDGPVDDRRRRGGARLRERGGARTDRLSRSLIPAQVLEEAGPVRAAFTTRRGGVSRGAYRSLNLTNRRRLAAALGIGPGACVEAEQVHGTGIAAVERLPYASRRPRRRPIPGVDALVTSERGIWLVIYAADCVPVLMLDVKTPAIAAVHAGWRGVAAGVVPAAVARMREAFGSAPRECIAVLGPAIGGCCYEVDAPVARAMGGAAWWPRAARPTGPGRWHLDLRTAVHEQLVASGVPARRVATVPY